MKILQSFFMLTLLACSARAMIEDVGDDTCGYDAYSEIEFDIDMDFFHERKIADAFNMARDCGWRALGFESNAYVKVKNELEKNQLTLEIILAMLSVEKYPTEQYVRSGFSKIIYEIKIGRLCADERVFNEKIYAIGFSNEYEKIYNLVRMLTKKERALIVDKLLKLEPLISMGDRQTQLTTGELVSVSECLKSMLKSFDDS